MIKRILIAVLGLLFLQNVKAQNKNDTLTFHMRVPTLYSTNGDSTDFLLMILPPDSSSGVKLYPIKEFYLNGKQKLITTSRTNDYDRLLFDGLEMDFNDNGVRTRIANYKNGELYGDAIYYYPNRKISAIINFKGNDDQEGKLIECHDSTGTVLAKNGSGTWIYWDKDYKNIITKGTVIDSLKDGIWEQVYKDRVICVNIYKQGEFISGTYYDKTGKEFPYNTREVVPRYKEGGEAGFNSFLMKNIRYPEQERRNRVMGRVIIQFVVEKDGTLSNIKVLRGPDEGLEEEAVRVVGLSPPWIPGIQNGLPVRVQFTIPVNFGIAGN